MLSVKSPCEEGLSVSPPKTVDADRSLKRPFGIDVFAPAADATEFIKILPTGLLPLNATSGTTIALFSITPSKFSP